MIISASDDEKEKTDAVWIVYEKEGGEDEGDGEDEDVGAASIAEDAGMSMLWYLPVRLKDEMEDDESGINEILVGELPLFDEVKKHAFSGG